MLLEYFGSRKNRELLTYIVVDVEKLRKTAVVVKLCGCNTILFSIQPSVNVEEKLGRRTSTKQQKSTEQYNIKL
jgi:hypothetical protein